MEVADARLLIYGKRLRTLVAGIHIFALPTQDVALSQRDVSQALPQKMFRLPLRQIVHNRPRRDTRLRIEFAL